MKNESFVSVVTSIRSFDEEVYTSLLEIQRNLDSNFNDYELVVVSLGDSTSPTSEELSNKLLLNAPSIRIIMLAGVVSNDVAYAAGVENAAGDFVVIFNHTTDSPTVIPELVNTCKSGNDVVIGIAKHSCSFTYKIFRKLGRKMLQRIGFNLPKDATDLRCLSRRAVNSVTRTGRFHHHFFMRIQKTGYPISNYYYELIDPLTLTKDFPTSSQQFLKLMVFNSTKPLRWASLTGAFGSFLALVFSSFSLLSHLWQGNVADGWTTTVLFSSILFMIQFIILAFFGEYLARMLDDRSDQDDYSIVYEKNSNVMVNQDRINVLNESISNNENLVQTGRRN